MSFSVYNTRLVTDPNQVTRFLLECIHSYLYQSRGALQAPGSGSAAAAGSSHYGATASAAMNAQGSGIVAGDDRTGGMTSENQQVLAIYKECSGADEENGLHLDEAIKFGKARGLSVEAVRRATNTLMMDGLIYSTVDDCTFRST
jgi:hypothetical protein